MVMCDQIDSTGRSHREQVKCVLVVSALESARMLTHSKGVVTCSTDGTIFLQTPHVQLPLTESLQHSLGDFLIVPWCGTRSSF